MTEYACGATTLFGRRVWIVELDVSELWRAEHCARRRNRPGLGRSNYAANRDAAGRFEGGAFGFAEADRIGAQGEVAAGKALGVRAPLHVDTFQSEPDIPPNWSVKTQLSTSATMRHRDLRIQRRDLGRGYRHLLVERETAPRGGFVFIVHGWVTDEIAASAGRQPYGFNDSTLVNLRHLTPLTRELYDTVHGAPTDEPPAPAPFDTDE